jgi:hypothetical protein
MGPLPQTPDDIIVALTLLPFVLDQSTMCETCAHGDGTAEEEFGVLNNCLNGALSIEDTITTIRGVKARPIRKQSQQMILGYQVKHAIIQEYPMTNDLITASVNSQHISIPHRECDYGWMIRAHITVPKCSDTSLMGIIEKRISGQFTAYCTQPMNGLGVFAVTKDHKVEQERQHIYYNFYLMLAPMFKPPMGYRHIGDEWLPTPPHIGILEAFCMENTMEDKGALRLMVEDDFFN